MESEFDLQYCLNRLDQQGKLVHIKTEVDPYHELCGLARHFEGGPVVLFDHVKNSDFPLVIGLFWNRKNLALMLGCEEQDLSCRLKQALETWLVNPIEPIISEKAPAQEIIDLSPDLSLYATPTITLGDGGPYLTSSLVVAKDPDTGVRNASVHRIMVTGKKSMTIFLGAGGHLKDYYNRAEARSQPLEITISNGIDPGLLLASTIPSASVPIERDELGIASSLWGKPLQLSRSITVDVEGIANAQYIIEGEIPPHEREFEGPFGENPGYYASRDRRWVVKVKAITRRKSPIIASLLPGLEVYNSIGLPSEINLLRIISNLIPGIKAVNMHHGGCGTYHAIIQMEPSRPGMAKNAICAAFAANPNLQMVTVVNSDVNIYNTDEILWALATRYRPDEDTVILPKMASQSINPVSTNGCSAKIGFDCTISSPGMDTSNRLRFQDTDLSRYEIG